MREMVLEQILLVTDGCSNVGGDPVEAAAEARRQGIVVNVIGVLHGQTLGEHGRREAERIAAAGGGVCQFAQPERLSHTVQAVTRQAMTRTLHAVVREELRTLLAEGNAASLAPEQRARLAASIETWAEACRLRVFLLLDTSASMAPLVPTVRRAVRDFFLCLAARTGPSELAVGAFPGAKGDLDLLVDWTTDGAAARLALERPPTGLTPTAPALRAALAHFRPRLASGEARGFAALPPASEKNAAGRASDGGLLRDYVF
ncbi:hypothetical protein JCM14719A_04230 [Calditerricola satsumensis]|uniref:VWFA domain-containing protein n=3 Tax=Calditerricola satsumensis TaxID=373054 RepID=A0A8J3BG30_9BACI|nr:hypothetical protein GCM10007043_22540 [Calditerricola satsumensis]